MEQLIEYKRNEIATISGGNIVEGFYQAVRIVSSMLNRKFVFLFSQAQIECLHHMTREFIAMNASTTTFEDKVFLFNVYKLFVKHIEPKIQRINKQFKIKLNWNETFTMYQLMNKIDVLDYGPFENSLIIYINGRIGAQA